MKTLVTLVALVGLSLVSAHAQWQPEPGDDSQRAAFETLQEFREQRAGELQRFFDEAYAIAVFPAVKRGALLIGYRF